MPSPSKTAFVHTPASSSPTAAGTSAHTRPVYPAIVKFTDAEASASASGYCHDCHCFLASELEYYKHVLDHELRRHKAPKEPVFCPWPGCPIQTTQRGNLAGHVNRRHTHEKPHGCKFCERKFASADRRTYHMHRDHPEYKPAARARYGSRKGRGAITMKSVTPEKVLHQLVQDQEKRRQTVQSRGKRRASAKAKATDATIPPVHGPENTAANVNVATPPVEVTGFDSRWMNDAQVASSSSNALGLDLPAGNAQSVQSSWDSSFSEFLFGPPSPSSSASSSSIATPLSQSNLPLMFEQSPEQRFEGLMYELLESGGCQKVETHLPSPSYPLTLGTSASPVPRGFTPRIPPPRSSSWPLSHVEFEYAMYGVTQPLPYPGFPEQSLGHPTPPSRTSLIQGWTNELGPHPVEPFRYDLSPLCEESFFLPQYGQC